MANPPKPWKAEYAKSSRSSCKTCKTPIEKETLRLGKMVQESQFDGFMPMWNHASCILKEAKQIGSTDDVEGLESLRLEDQQKIKEYVEEGVESSSLKAFGYSIYECGVEVSSTSRATCHTCNDKIMKGEIRVSTKPEGQSARSLVWHHAKCYLEATSDAQVESFAGWDNLSASERESLLSFDKKNLSTSKGTNSKPKDETAVLPESTTKGDAKRKKSKRKNTVESDQKSKLARAGDAIIDKLSNIKLPKIKKT